VALLVAAAPFSAPLLARSGESERLAEALALRPGMSVADVGAGRGEWAKDISRRVGPAGRVFATEVEQDKVDRIAERIADAGLTNVTTLLGTDEDTGLPAGCCDAILLRLVYHHFTDPAKMRRSLVRSLRPGARLVVVDTEPHGSWPSLPGVPDRGGHGIAPEDLIAELTGEGFTVLERHDEWPDSDSDYCVVFRAPGGTAMAGADRP
jgi:SAM-dependent methyltransferase